MRYTGLEAGAATLPLASLLRNLPAAVPALSSAVANYTRAYQAAMPALQARGGMNATLRAAPQLAGNMDAFLRDVGAVQLIPARVGAASAHGARLLV